MALNYANSNAADKLKAPRLRGAARGVTAHSDQHGGVAPSDILRWLWLVPWR